MTNYISVEKMSKKKKKEYYAKKRQTWGNVKPITQRVNSKKAYNRRNNKKIIKEAY